MGMTLVSPEFADKGEIPKKNSCDGVGVSPALTWKDVPANAKSLVLIVEDPDCPDPSSPKTVWTHWLLYNLPPSSSGLAEGIESNELPEGTLEGINDFHSTGYGAPCPPIGQHRYFHKLYALDTVLPDLHRPTKAMLEDAMQGHVIAQCEIVGTYQH